MLNRESAIELVEALADTSPGQSLQIVIESIMHFYLDTSRDAPYSKAGPGDAAQAYLAVKKIMEAAAALQTYDELVAATRSHLNAMTSTGEKRAGPGWSAGR